MRFVINRDWILTGRFPDKRDNRSGIHGAWDIATPLYTPILAPENGLLYFHKIWRSDAEQRVSEPRYSWFWPDNRWYLFSGYYADNYGCALMLFSESNHCYLFCHVEEDCFYRRLFVSGSRYNIQLRRIAYNRWVKSCLTLDYPKRVLEGEEIGEVGDEGHSTGPHIHLEVHNDRTWGRVDPMTIWPVEYKAHKDDKV